MGEIITFYSYKGGVGRTMALSNIAIILAKWGYKTLILDWDLESPGLEFFFRDFLNLETISSTKGILDILSCPEMSRIQDSLKWQDCIIEISLPTVPNFLHFITAGKRDENYFKKLKNLDLGEFYRLKQGGLIIEILMNDWKQLYDLSVTFFMFS